MVEIKIVDFDPNWPNRFEIERALIQSALGGQHIGSTAVTGLGAKPVIDIMIGVKSLLDADAFCVPALVGLGYEYDNSLETELPGRRYLRRNDRDGLRTHHIHALE